MQTRTRCIAVLISALFAVALSACGGGGSGGDGDSGGGDPGDASVSPGIGQVLLGPIVDAQVRVLDPYTLEVLCETTTERSSDLEQAGRVELPAGCAENVELVLVSVIGGEDIDANDDAIVDPTPTPLRGTLLALLTGAQLSADGWRVSLATDLVARPVSEVLGEYADIEDLVAALDRAAQTLLKDDVNLDGSLDHLDIGVWHARDDRESLDVSDEDLAELLRQIHSGDQPEFTPLPDSPRLLSNLNLGPIVDIELLDGPLAVVLAKGLVLTLDLADPSMPIIGKPLPLGAPARAIAATAEHLYVGVGSSLRVFELDAVSGIGALRETVQVSVRVEGLHVSGDRLFVVDRDSTRLYRIGVNGLDLIEATLFIANGGGRLLAVQDLLYIADPTTGFSILDFSDPANPAVLFQRAEGFPPHAFHFAAVGATLYFAGNRDILDVSMPSSTGVLGSLNAVYSRIASVGGTLFAVTRNSIDVLDTSTPASPVVVEQLVSGELIFDIAAGQGLLLVGTGSNGLGVYDITDLVVPAPVPPSLVPGRAMLQGPVAGASVSVSRWDEGALLLGCDVTTSSGQDPAQAGVITLPPSCVAADGIYVVEVSGGMAVDVDGDGVIDAMPTQVQGSWRAVLQSTTFGVENWGVSTLTEVAYRYLEPGLADPNRRSLELDRIAAFLLEEDVTGNGNVDHRDLVAWDASLPDALQGDIALLDAVAQAVTADQGIETAARAYAAPLTALVRNVEPRMDVRDARLALAHGQMLSLYTLSDPYEPRVQSTVSLARNPSQGVALTTTSILAGGIDGPYVYPIGTGGNIEAPVVVPTTPAAPPLHFTVDGTLAVYSQPNSRQVVVSDISDPLSLPTTATIDAFDASNAVGLDLHNGLLLLGEGPAFSRLFDLSNPSVPSQVFTFAEELAEPELNGNRLTGVDRFSSPRRVRVYDVSSAANPVLVDQVIDNRASKSVLVDGRLIVGSLDGGLAVYDANSSGLPLVRRIVAPGAVLDVRFGTGVIVITVDEFVYVFDRSDITG